MATPIPLIVRDEPFAEPTTVDLPAGVPTAVIRTAAVTVADLPALFDVGFRKLAALGPVGPGFAVYHGDPRSTFDLEIGFPVARPVDTDGVAGAEFPRGRAMVLSHLGGFDGLGAAWETLAAAYTAENAAEPRLSVEVYVTDPSTTAEKDLRTDLFLVH